ncbi:MAG: hypothetical protein DMD60_06045 [Gemmatimonadetes bacterium]|nr:MAG: hypothetical protein DMD60_06045 [Gemmatimonadota bacterium]
MSFAKQFVSSIDANRTVKDELGEAVGKQRARRRISVTDLVNLRQAFFRWTRPDIQPAPERLQLILSGTGFHELFGKLVSTEEYVEQFVEYNEIVGRIDIYDDVPTELKTTGFIPEDIHGERPGYVDQLGMYCAMTGRASGRLVVYKRARYGLAPTLKVFEIAYNDLESIAHEMIRRRDSLRKALDTLKASELPRCEWFELGCDYREICGCESAAPLGRLVGREGAQIVESQTLADSFDKYVRREPSLDPAFKLNDLVFPRRTAFAHKATEDDESVPVVDPAIEVQLARLERRGFSGALFGAIRFGIPGAFSRMPVQLRSLTGWVNTYRGTPTILRTSKFREMVERARLADGFPHYIDRLAFECALTGREFGRVVVYYEQLQGDKFMVYDVAFGGLDKIRAEADRRLQLLEAGADPKELPPCPKWMSKFCDFAPACGCGGEAAHR